MSGKNVVESQKQSDTKVSARDDARVATLELAVLGPTGYATYPLAPGQPRVVGRDRGVDIVLDDPSVSRRHARLYIEDQVEIEDLGSSNGTYVRGSRLSMGLRVRVDVGEAFRVGDQVLLVQRVVEGAGKPRRIHRADYIEARLDEECARGVRVALVKIQVDPPSARALDEVAAELAESDILALTGASEYCALLLGGGAPEAEDFVARVRPRLTELGLQPRIAVACHPRDGRAAAPLLDAVDRRLRGLESSSVTEATGVVMSPRLRSVYAQIDRVAAGDISILILGETGVGKDVLANHAHKSSPRGSGPFVRINCAALAESLVESELFGHERGAFTGATQAKPGLLETARGGTVFLDEVGEIPLTVQAKLLQVIEQKQVLRVGGLTAYPIDVRFVAATNRDLEREAERGAFRQDLYYRLAGFTVTLPPLRERRDEILPLTYHFLARARRTITGDMLRFSPEAEDLLVQYSWPGNVRELRHVVERAVLLCSGSEITVEQLPAEKMRSTLLVRADGGTPTTDELPALPPDKERDRERIKQVLEECAGNQSEAARRLGIARSTLIARIEEYGLRRPRKR